MKQKLLILLTAMLVALTASAYNFAVTDADGVTIYFNYTGDNNLEVTNGPKEYEGTVVIPSIVTFENESYTVTSIGDWAFSGCTSLVSVKIPESVTSVGRGAFYGCSSLTFVTIPDSVTSIGDSAFSGCTSMAFVIIPDSVIFIGNGTFNGCSSLYTVTIPESVTSIGNAVFWGCSSLTFVTIPDSVTSIGDYAFHECTSLTTVTIPNLVTSIGEYAFEGSGLISVTIPESVKYIGEGAFSSCENLSSFYGKFSSKDNKCLIIDGTLMSVAPYELTSFTIPDEVTSINKRAFRGCKSLANLNIPKSVTEIESYGCFLDTALYNDESNWQDGELYISDCLIRVVDILLGDIAVR